MTEDEITQAARAYASRFLISNDGVLNACINDFRAGYTAGLERAAKEICPRCKSSEPVVDAFGKAGHNHERGHIVICTGWQVRSLIPKEAEK